MDDRSTLLREIEAAWRPYADALDALSDDDLLEIADGTWTRKDLVAHVAWWEGSSTSTLEAVAEHRDPPWRDETTDETNARVEAEHKDVPGPEIRTMAAVAHERLLRAIAAVDEADLSTAGRFPFMNGDALIALVRGDTSEHYPEHVRQLRGE